jgi:hypothetical protein
MNRDGDNDVSLSDTPKQQPSDAEKSMPLSDKPISKDRPTLPFAADATHDPEDPLRNQGYASDEKFDSSSDSDAHVGDVADVQNGSLRQHKLSLFSSQMK